MSGLFFCCIVEPEKTQQKPWNVLQQLLLQCSCRFEWGKLIDFFPYPQKAQVLPICHCSLIAAQTSFYFHGQQGGLIFFPFEHNLPGSVRFHDTLLTTTITTLVYLRNPIPHQKKTTLTKMLEFCTLFTDRVPQHVVIYVFIYSRNKWPFKFPFLNYHPISIGIEFVTLIVPNKPT